MTTAPLPPAGAAARRPTRVGSARGWRRILRVFTVLHGWAESGWSRSAMATWGVLQGSVVPGPCDGLLIPLGLADPPRAYALALWGIVGSIVGGVFAYLLGAHAFDDVGRTLLAWVGVSTAQLGASRALFDRYGGMIVALSAIIPVPTKMMCIAAGVLGVPFPAFAAGITIGRTVRFLAVATALRYAGAGILRWVQTRTPRASDP